jgi:hypothetical protein
LQRMNWRKLVGSCPVTAMTSSVTSAMPVKVPS